MASVETVSAGGAVAADSMGPPPAVDAAPVEVVADSSATDATATDATDAPTETGER